MIKKIIMIVVIISVVQVNAFAFAYSSNGEQSAYNLGLIGVLKAEVFEDAGEITRYEVLETIMHVISGNDNRDYGDMDNLPGFYNDFEKEIEEWLKNDKFLYEYADGSNDYIALAFYNGIAKGVNIDGQTYFMFEKKATIAETITFMVRCLTGKCVTMEEAHTYATENGLIYKYELAYKSYINCCQNIDFDYFCILLERFVNQKRYMYLNVDDESFPQVSIDTDGTITYKEYLLQKSVQVNNDLNIMFTPQMAQEIADMVFKSKFGDIFIAMNSTITIDELETMYRITRKPPESATSAGITIYINKSNGAVIDMVK